MRWENKAKVHEILIDRLNAKEYKQDFKFDFDRLQIQFEKVSGLDAFIQKFKKVLLTNETPVIKYGLAHLLPTSSDQTEFDKQCTILSEAILNHKFSDSTPENPNGLGRQSICSIG